MSHQLPAYLGSAECKIIATHDDGTADVELLDTAAGLRLRLPKADLTEVTGPSELALSYEDLEAERDRLARELYVAQEQIEDLRRQLAGQKPPARQGQALMKIYTKTVTAIQWTGDNAAEIEEVMGPDHFEAHGEGENEDDPDANASMRDDHRGGTWYPLVTGDWILRDDAGDWHSCGAERFTATYKAVKE